MQLVLLLPCFCFKGVNEITTYKLYLKLYKCDHGYLLISCAGLLKIYFRETLLAFQPALHH